MLPMKKRELKKLPPSYKKEIEILEQKYSAIKKFKRFQRIKKLLTEFSQNYVMLPHLWDELFHATREVVCKMYNGASRRFYQNCIEGDKLEILSRKHFYSKVNGSRRHRFTKLLQESPELSEDFVDYKIVISELSVPRKNLNKTWKHFKEYSSAPIPRHLFSMHEKNVKLYDELIAAENDTEKWFQLIVQVEDVEYVCNNAEYKIGNDLKNIQLWKLYLQHLKEKDTKRLLYVYSCYCRFFLDDVAMKEEYKKETKKYGPSIVHWKNAFDFEKYEAEKIEESEEKKTKEEDENQYKLSDLHKRWKNLQDSQIQANTDTINATNFKNQVFSLPKPIINYVIKPDNSNVLYKLHQTCKYFFAILPYPTCHNFIMSSDRSSRTPLIKRCYIEFNEHSVWFGHGYRHDLIPDTITFLRKFVISNTFHCRYFNRTMLSKFLPNVFQCNAKHILIDDQDFTFKELKFLIGHGNVEMLHLHNVEITSDDQDDEIMELHDILPLTPKILDFQITEPEIAENTFEILTQLNFKNKFKIFNLRKINCLEPYGFSQFLKKNLDSKSEVQVAFWHEIAQNIAQNAITAINNELKDYWPKNEEPKIDVHHSAHQNQGFHLGSKNEPQ